MQSVSLSLPTGTSSSAMPNIPSMVGASLNLQPVGVAPGIDAANPFVTKGLSPTFGG